MVALGSLATAAGGALTSSVPAIAAGAATSYMLGRQMSKAMSSIPPPVPASSIQIPEIKLPDQTVTIEAPTPQAPPNAPLSPNATAAVQRARSQSRGEGAGSPAKLTLTTPQVREQKLGPVRRATLLGR